MTVSMAADSLQHQIQPTPPKFASKTFAEFFAGIGLVEEGLRNYL
jgi:hypothetical protein